MKRIALQALVIAPFFVVAPGVWNDCQPAAGLFLALSGVALIWADHDLESDAIVLAGAALALGVLTMPLSVSFSRPGGYYANPNTAGAALAFLLMLALWRRRWVYAGLIMAGLLRTVSVGAILGTGAGIIVLGASYAPIRRWVGNHKRWVILGSVAGLVVAGAAGYVLFLSRPWWPQRLGFYRTAIQMIQAAPLTGHGGGSFQLTQWAVGFDPGWSRVKTQIIPHAHNLYLHVGAEYGLISLGALLVALALAWWKSNPPARAALAVLAVHSMVDCTVLYLPVAFSLWSVLYVGGAFESARLQTCAPRIATS